MLNMTSSTSSKIRIDAAKLLIKIATTFCVTMFLVLFFAPWACIMLGNYEKNSLWTLAGISLLVLYITAVGAKVFTTNYREVFPSRYEEGGKPISFAEKIATTVAGVMSCPAWVAIRITQFIFGDF